MDSRLSEHGRDFGRSDRGYARYIFFLYTPNCFIYKTKDASYVLSMRQSRGFSSVERKFQDHNQRVPRITPSTSGREAAFGRLVLAEITHKKDHYHHRAAKGWQNVLSFSNYENAAIRWEGHK